MRSVGIIGRVAIRKNDGSFALKPVLKGRRQRFGGGRALVKQRQDEKTGVLVFGSALLDAGFPAIIIPGGGAVLRAAGD